MNKTDFFVPMIVLITVGFFSCQHTSGQKESREVEGQRNDKGTPVIKFSEESHDFGDIAPGEKVSYTFTYTNAGDADLVILTAAASCGCTVPKWKKDPLPPGKKGYIEVVFDTSGRRGKQVKNITIRSNCDPPVTVLQIQANIVEINN